MSDSGEMVPGLTGSPAARVCQRGEPEPTLLRGWGTLPQDLYLPSRFSYSSASTRSGPALAVPLLKPVSDVGLLHPRPHGLQPVAELQRPSPTRAAKLVSSCVLWTTLTVAARSALRVPPTRRRHPLGLIRHDSMARSQGQELPTMTVGFALYLLVRSLASVGCGSER